MAPCEGYPAKIDAPYQVLRGNGKIGGAAGVDLKTAQELLRHANSRITLEVYTRAISSTKRGANDRVMQMMLDAGQKKILAPSPAPSAP